MSNTLAQKIYEVNKKKQASRNIFNIDENGILYGFSESFLDFVNKNIIIRRNEYNTEHKRLQSELKENLEKFDEQSDEVLDSQWNLITHEREYHPYLKMRQFEELLKQNFDHAECLDFYFPKYSENPYSWGKYVDLHCNVHLENESLEIKKIAGFPAFIPKRCNRNWDLPNNRCDVNFYMTTHQILNVDVTPNVPFATSAYISNPCDNEKFIQVANHWNTQVMKHFNSFLDQQAEYRKEGNKRLLDRHPISIFNLYNKPMLTGTRIMTFIKNHEPLNCEITLYTCCEKGEELEKAVSENAPKEGMKVDFNHQTPMTKKTNK